MSETTRETTRETTPEAMRETATRHGTKLAAVLSGWFIALSVMGSSAQAWEELLTPSFIFGALGQLGVALGALYSHNPAAGGPRRMPPSPPSLRQELRS